MIVVSAVFPHIGPFQQRRNRPARSGVRLLSLRVLPLLRHNKDVPGISPQIALPLRTADYRLRKHADYQRVYREGRKNFSASMSYFYALRGSALPAVAGPRIGLTAGKVLGKAVERNRIKRRMRDIVRRRAALLSADVDIVLHPRRGVLAIEFAKLDSEVVRIFNTIQGAIDKGPTDKGPTDKGPTDKGPTDKGPTNKRRTKQTPQELQVTS
jgi:ribonuclease P protein component